jgi:hypothetical protein
MPRYLSVLVLALACSSAGHYARSLRHDRLVGLLQRYGRNARRR